MKKKTSRGEEGLFGKRGRQRRPLLEQIKIRQYSEGSCENEQKGKERSFFFLIGTATILGRRRQLERKKPRRQGKNEEGSRGGAFRGGKKPAKKNVSSTKGRKGIKRGKTGGGGGHRDRGQKRKFVPNATRESRKTPPRKSWGGELAPHL